MKLHLQAGREKSLVQVHHHLPQGQKRGLAQADLEKELKEANLQLQEDKGKKPAQANLNRSFRLLQFVQIFQWKEPKDFTILVMTSQHYKHNIIACFIR